MLNHPARPLGAHQFAPLDTAIARRAALQLRRSFWLWSLGLSLLLAAALLWPLPARLHSHTIDTGDALHLAWTVRWAQGTLLGQSAPFSAPAGYPYGATLLLNPPLYTPALMGLPLHLLGWSATAVYGLLTLLSFALACWALMLLGRQVSGSGAAGLVAGLVYAFSDVRLAYLSHLNLLSGFWTALLLLLLLRARRHPPRGRRGQVALALGAGLLAAAQALSDVYNTIYMAVAVALFALFWAAGQAARLRRREAGAARDALGTIVALGAGALLALGLTAPVLLPTLAAWRDMGIARAWADHERYAAAPGHYLFPRHERPLYSLEALRGPDLAADPTEQRLWPGAATLALAAVGLLAGRGRERWLFAALGLVALALSLGPRLELGGWRGELPYYRWLFEHVPLFGAARVPARWALLLQLALAVLAACGAARLLERMRGPTYGSGAFAFCMLHVAVAGLALADVRPAHVPTTAKAVGEPTPAVYAALAELPAGALLEWPLENASPTLAHRYQHYTLAHGRPIVNSAGSAPPPRYARLVEALRDFPSNAATRLLRDMGVRYVVVNRWEIGTWGELEPRLAAAPGLRLLGSYDDGRHLLYAVADAQPEAPAPLAVVAPAPGGARLDLQLAAPLWLDSPAALYRGERATAVELVGAAGEVVSLSLSLPPLLLPGGYSWPLPAAALGARELRVAGHALPLGAAPALAAGDGARLAAGPLPARLAPGDTLPCLAYGELPARPGLVLAAALVDDGWDLAAKRDHFLGEAGPGAPLPCNLPLPGDLPPGDYFLALGLFDPATGGFVPVTGADGTLSPGLWRVPRPITVG